MSFLAVVISLVLTFAFALHLHMLTLSDTIIDLAF